MNHQQLPWCNSENIPPRLFLQQQLRPEEATAVEHIKSQEYKQKKIIITFRI
jgi:hypothetical protein